MNIKQKLVIALLISISIIVNCEETTNTLKTKSDKIWKLDLTGLSLNPMAWTIGMRERMYQVGIGTFAALAMQLPLQHCIAFAAFLFGLTQLSWASVALATISLYGWRLNETAYYLVGLGLLYVTTSGIKLP